MRLLALALAFVGAFAFGPVARADDTTTVQGANKTVYKKNTVIDFTDVTLSGTLAKPQGEYGLSRTEAKFGSLIKYRLHFDPELQKSQDQL